MKASTSSLHARLYRFTYTSDLPPNLCPYFWKLFIAILLFIPNFILQLPGLIVDLFIKPDKGAIMLNASDNRTAGLVFYFFLFVGGLYCYITFHLIKQMLNCYSYNLGASICGAAVNLTIFFLIAWQLIKILYRKLRPAETAKPKEPNIITEFVKAKYNKYCPKIEWHEKSKA